MAVVRGGGGYPNNVKKLLKNGHRLKHTGFDSGRFWGTLAADLIGCQTRVGLKALRTQGLAAACADKPQRQQRLIHDHVTLGREAQVNLDERLAKENWLITCRLAQSFVRAPPARLGTVHSLGTLVLPFVPP